MKESSASLRYHSGWNSNQICRKVGRLWAAPKNQGRYSLHERKNPSNQLRCWPRRREMNHSLRNISLVNWSFSRSDCKKWNCWSTGTSHISSRTKPDRMQLVWKAQLLKIDRHTPMPPMTPSHSLFIVFHPLHVWVYSCVYTWSSIWVEFNLDFQTP
jgi:hypothetical protein